MRLIKLKDVNGHTIYANTDLILYFGENRCMDVDSIDIKFLDGQVFRLDPNFLSLNTLIQKIILQEEHKGLLGDTLKGENNYD